MFDAHLWHNMFSMPLSVAEKVLRPVLMYVVLIAFLRAFGKRELAQLNPFDLVVLLCLSNTVQNAIIGDDNSLSGGVVGAFALLGVNWLVSKMIFHFPKLNRMLEGRKTVLIQDGEVDLNAMKRETLTHEELISILNKNNYATPAEVKTCVLEPNGTFFVTGMTPTGDQKQAADLMKAVEKMARELKELRAELAARG